MEKAIKRALEGGYAKNDPIILKSFLDHYEIHLLSPLFWQALGKAEGWEDECDKCGTLQTVIDSEVAEYNESVCKVHNGLGNAHIMFFQWKAVWHKFIDHLAEGKDAESFFKNLLK